MASVVIDIASEFTGKKAFSKAETATKTLTKSVKGLAGAFGLAFGARGAMQAVKAFAADDKAAKVLSKTLNNLGLAFADPAVKKFISDLERQYGVLDDKLRPAYQMLLTSTGDYIKSQDLLRTALDLSAMSGVDVVSVSADLSKAYQGNTRGLMKYQLGLTKAELAAMSFEEILAQVAKVSKGQAQIAADSYAGSLDKLSVASANVAESLGKDLVDALAILGGEGGLPKTLSLIESISGAIGTAIINAARFIRVLDVVTGSGAFNMLGDLKKAFADFEAQDKARGASKFAGTGMATSYQGKKAQDALALAAAKKITNEGKKTAAAALATAKAKQLSLAIDKANLALAKGTDVFDMDKIQLNAALIGQAEALGKATTSSQILAIANDVQRLKIKQDIAALEDAIASKDTAAIERATKKLNEDLKILGTLQNQAVKLADIKSILDSIIPKDLIDQQNLDDALEKIKKMMLLLAGGLGTINLGGGGGGGGGSSEIDLTTIPKRPRLTGKESIGAIIEVADASAALANAIAAEIEARNAAAAKALDSSILTQIAAAAAQATIEANRERYGNQGSAPVITIVDKTSGLIEVVQTAVQENNRFGNNLNFAGAL
jgi:hypothetical protein